LLSPSLGNRPVDTECIPLTAGSTPLTAGCDPLSRFAAGSVGTDEVLRIHQRRE